MPLASPIGSNKGLATKDFIQILIDEIDLPIIVDAGIGKPSQACEAMEMGAAAIMANTALATAGDLPLMAAAFKQAIEAGRKAYLAGLGRVLTRGAYCFGSADRIFKRLEVSEVENQFFIDSEYLSEKALEKKHRLETDPSSRKNHMEYMPGMEQIESQVCGQVMGQMKDYDYSVYTASDVRAALNHETCSVEDFKALLFCSSRPFLEEMAPRARMRNRTAFWKHRVSFYTFVYCQLLRKLLCVLWI